MQFYESTDQGCVTTSVSVIGETGLFIGSLMLVGRQWKRKKTKFSKQKTTLFLMNFTRSSLLFEEWRTIVLTDL